MMGFKNTYTLPFKFEIPNYSDEYIKNNSINPRVIKYIRRNLFMLFKWQKPLERHNILKEENKILWINISAPSIGDSLMDLSSRILLSEKKIDLFTDKKNSNVFKNDHIFENIFTNVNDVKGNIYDLIIVDSYSSRTIKIKSKIALKTPFVSMFGHFNGPEVNRVLFSFHRLNQLIGYKFSNDDINLFSKASISISKKDIKTIFNLNLPKKFIVIALGGEWEYRSYRYWHQLIKQLLARYSQIKIVLVGSNNALEILDEISKNVSSENLIDMVNKLSFNQTAEIIRNSKLLVCCDGGLMHSANAVSTPVVPLFARLTSKMQLTDAICSFPLFDEENVNNIEVSDLMIKVEEAFKFLNIYHLNE